MNQNPEDINLNPITDDTVSEAILGSKGLKKFDELEKNSLENFDPSQHENF